METEKKRIQKRQIRGVRLVVVLLALMVKVTVQSFCRVYWKSRVDSGIFPIFAALALAFLFLSSAGARHSAEAASSTDTPIAYVNGLTGDEIRLIEPDGSNDRRLWAHGQADPENVYDIWSLSWQPDGSELTFASTHENWCSINYADIYAIGANGTGYRRITQAPACEALAAYPHGTVEIPVENNSIFGESVDVFLYFQGAPAAQQVSLPPGSSTVVTFDDVADFGAVVQFAVEIEGAERVVHAGSAVDVQAGATVQTATIYVPGGVMPGREVRWPTWRHNGSRIGYVSGFNSIEQIVARPEPLQPGSPLLTANSSELPDFVDHLVWGSGTRANQLLYAGYEFLDETGVYLATEGSSSAGEPLVTYDASAFVAFIRGLVWLPDGSGFAFSLLEDEFYSPVSANIYEYNFATGATTRITDFDDLFVGQMSVSPNGEQIVFELSATDDGSAPTNLWIMNRDGSGQQLLVQNGRAPAWTPPAVAPPPGADYSVYLPTVRGGG